jgi:hypothetical protein
MNIFEEYYKVRQQLDVLKEKEAELKEQVLVEAMKVDTPTVKTKFGNFTKRVSKTWSYSLDFTLATVEIEKQIREFGKPFQEKIEAYAKPLREQIEGMKKKEIYEGKATEQTSIGIAFSYSQPTNEEIKNGKQD